MRRPVKNKKQVTQDFKYNSEKVSRLVNYLMLDGKKSIAREIVYDAFDIIKKQEKTEDPVAVFESAIRNVSPLMELRSRRIGGANYQIPIEVSSSRRLALALRWIIKSAREKKGVNMAKSLAGELILASKNEGTSVMKRENTHKMAEANRAFAHLGW